MTTTQLDRLDTIEQRRNRLLGELASLDVKRHAAIVAALDDGASLTAVARVVGITRQALTRYLDRRENHAG